MFENLLNSYNNDEVENDKFSAEFDNMIENREAYIAPINKEVPEFEPIPELNEGIIDIPSPISEEEKESSLKSPMELFEGIGQEQELEEPTMENKDLDIFDKTGLDMFINTNRSYEGGDTPNVTHVPTSRGKVIGKSGITNREGIDFGQQSEANLRKWGVSDDLINKIKPAIGVQGQDALNISLDLTEEESKEISQKYLQYSDAQLSRNYDTYKNANSEIKSELIQLRTHNFRLGKYVDTVLKKKYDNQGDLARDLALAIEKTGKGDKNRVKKTVSALKKIYRKLK